MPTVLRVSGFRFFFYSNEGDPREPPHIHVMRTGAEAKLWLIPEVAVAGSAGFNARELRQIAALVSEHRNAFEEAWHGYFG